MPGNFWADNCGSFSTPQMATLYDRFQTKDSSLSHDVAVIQWIMFYHKNSMTTGVITLRRIYVTSLIMTVSAEHFLIEIMFIL